MRPIKVEVLFIVPDSIPPEDCAQLVKEALEGEIDTATNDFSFATFEVQSALYDS
jgi:hypothetical protein